MTGSLPGDIFRPGDLLNNTYRIDAVLGRGGLSEVYRARSEISGRLVAIKVLNRVYAQNEAFVVLMTREEEIRDIRHEAVVRYSECQRTDDGDVYIVMDYVDGVALDARMDAGGMVMRDLLTVGARVAEGLEATHAGNVIHRDLSPDNIILRGDNPSDAVIIDFGIAKDATPGARTIVGGQFAGKYAYAAPEQFRGETDARSDIYSLGALLLACYRGAEPAVSDMPADVIEYKRTALNTTDVPQPLRGLLDKMVQPDPADRFQSAAEMRAAFDIAIAPPREATAIQPEAAVTPPAPATAPRALWPLVLLGLLALSGGGAYVAWQHGMFLPQVDPLVLTVRDSRTGPPQIAGHVPSAAARTALATLLENAGGSAALNVARPVVALPDAWTETVSDTIATALDLPGFEIVVEDANLRVTGQADTPSQRDGVATRFAALPVPPGLTRDVSLTLPEGRLFSETLAPILADEAKCGPLRTPPLPSEGLRAGARLTVSGKIADSSARLALAAALEGAAGPRPLDLRLQELNASTCLVLNALPNIPEGPLEIAYAFGRTGQDNATNRFFPGENPVIDVELPEDIIDGFLYVMLVDAAGNAARLLPNPFRQEHDIRSLRNGRSGPVLVRIAFSQLEARGTRRLTLTMDSSAPGIGLVIALVTDAPIVPAPGRTSETVDALAGAIRAAIDTSAGRVLAVRTRLLESAQN